MFRRLILALAFCIAGIALASPLDPAQRPARYQKDPDGKYGPAMFQFAPEVVIEESESIANARTAIAIDPFGNTYVASDGSSITLGDPQVTVGKLYVHQYPQWAAALGVARLYVASSADTRLVLRRSDDGARTYGHETVIAQLTDGAAVGGQGNLIVNGAGSLFNVFTGTARNEIYLAKCLEPCERFTTRRIFSGGPGIAVDHPYPVIAMDHGGGLHVVFSDGHAVFVISSADGGATWKNPAAVNNPEDLDTAGAMSPWVFAGDAGRLGITWLGSQGEVYYSFTPDAFAPVPTFNYVRVGDAQPNASLPSAAADPFGNANIVYGHTRILRQIVGDLLIVGPSMTVAGSLKTETGSKRVSFSVRPDFKGTLTYLDEQRRLSLRSVHFSSSKRIDQKIAVSGSGRLQDGSEVTFTLVTAEPSTAGKDKSFSISMSNGYFAVGVLQETPTIEARR